MLVFLFIFILSFAKTHQYIDSAYADAFMANKQCLEASNLYLSDFKVSKNPFIASNYALSLFCLNKIAAAKYYINLAYVNIDKADKLDKRTAILYNYAHIYSYTYLFKLAQNVLDLIDLSNIDTETKAKVLSLSCRNYMYLNNYKEAKEHCMKAYLIKPNSCFLAHTYTKLLYKNSEYNEAIKIFDKIFAKCKNEDISYYYSLSLYKSSNKEYALTVLKDFIDNARNKALYDLIMKEFY